MGRHGDCLILNGEEHAVPPMQKVSGSPRMSICLFYATASEYNASSVSVLANGSKTLIETLLIYKGIVNMRLLSDPYKIPTHTILNGWHEGGMDEGPLPPHLCGGWPKAIPIIGRFLSTRVLRIHDFDFTLILAYPH